MKDGGAACEAGPEDEEDGRSGEDARAASEDGSGGHTGGPVGGSADGAALGQQQRELEWDALEDGTAPTSADWCCSPSQQQPADSDWHPVPAVCSSPAPEDGDGAPVDAAPPDDFALAAAAGPQPLQLAGGCGYVWSAAAARRLRQLGVPGQLAGGLARAPRQSAQLGLPLTLMPEEAALLHSQGLCELVRYPELLAPRSADQRRRLDQHEEASTAAQQRLMTLARHKQLLERAEQIVDGKWRKLEKLRAAGKPAPDTSRQQLRFEFIEQLRASVRPPSAEHCCRQLYCGHPLTLSPEPVPPPPPDHPLERARRAVYSDLWRRGYWLTDGLKFGGHLLAYEGDPLVFHAVFVVRCVTRRPHLRELAGLQRLANGCGKRLLLSWLDGDRVRHEQVSRRPRLLRALRPERTGVWTEGDGRSKTDGRLEGADRLTEQTKIRSQTDSGSEMDDDGSMTGPDSTDFAEHAVEVISREGTLPVEASSVLAGSS